MSIIYVTKDGDVLDQICQNYYSSTDKIIEQVLEVNPHLANLEAIFTAGIKITLPDIVIQKESEVVKLWS
jgi:phage tail protein X